MFKQKYVLEVKGQEDRIYRFECDAGAPLGELNDALYTMKGVVLKQLNEQLHVTLLMVTHDVEAARIAGQQYILNHGKLVQTGGEKFQPALFSEAQETAG